jgi:antitoxin VapB
METAKIFTNGGSQAVRLPKQYRFNSEEVIINRIGNIVMLIPKDDQWENTLRSLDMFTDDFLANPIEPLPLENREAIL